MVCHGQQQSERSSESCDNTLHSASELLQRWRNKLVFPLSELGERYLRKDFALLIQCSEQSSPFIPGNSFSICVRSCGCNDLRRNIGGKNQIPDGFNDHKFPMLIESVHVVDDQNGTIRRVCSELVGLKVADEFSGLTRISDPTYLSLKLLQCFRVGGIAEDRELDRVLAGLAVGSIRENPDDVIEAATKMMNDFTSQDREAFRNSQVAMIVNRILPSLVIWLGNSRVFAFLKKLDDLVFKIEDVLVGPM